MNVPAQEFSNVLPKFRARIFGIQAGKFAQNFFGALVPRHGDIYLYLDDLIAARALFCCGRDAFFPQAQLLTRLCSRRDFEDSATIDGRYLNLTSQCGLRRGHRDSQINIVALAAENRMIAGPDDYVQVSRGTSVGTRISFARDTNALAVASSRLDAHFEWFGALDSAFAVTNVAGGYVTARAVTPRAGDVELHASAGLLDRSLALAFRTDSRRFDIDLTGKDRANIATCEIKAHDIVTHLGLNGNMYLIIKYI